MNQLFDSIFFLRINLQIYFYFLKNRRAWLQLFRLRFYILVSFLKNIFSNKKICLYSFWHLWVWHCCSFTYGLRIPLNHFQNNPTSTKNPRACLPNLYLPLFFFFLYLESYTIVLVSRNFEPKIFPSLNCSSSRPFSLIPAGIRGFEEITLIRWQPRLFLSKSLPLYFLSRFAIERMKSVKREEGNGKCAE